MQPTPVQRSQEVPVGGYMSSQGSYKKASTATALVARTRIWILVSWS